MKQIATFTKWNFSFHIFSCPQQVRCTSLSSAIVPPGFDDFHECVTTNLRNNQGQYLRLSTKFGLKLIAEELQNGAVCEKHEENVEIWKCNNYFALCFKNGSNKYLITVNGGTLKIKKTFDVKKDISINSCFQKENVGMGTVGTDMYCIKTANSTKYLVINEENNHITLSETKLDNGIFTATLFQCNKEGCTGL